MNNKDEKLEEVITENEIVKEEIEVKKENSNELIKEDVLEKDTESNENPSMFKILFASLLDQAILLGVSALILLVFDLVIGLFGYFVKLPTPVLLIIYGIVNVLYHPLIEKKGKKSIGKRILSIK